MQHSPHLNVLLVAILWTLSSNLECKTIAVKTSHTTSYCTPGNYTIISMSYANNPYKPYTKCANQHAADSRNTAMTSPYHSPKQHASKVPVG